MPEATSPDLQKIERAAKSIVDRMFEATDRDPAVWKFRSSALPICQVDMAISKMTEKVNRAMPRTWNFRADFYTGIGTGLHSAIQRWLGKIGVLFGHWRCNRCSITLRNLLGTQYCLECKEEMEYEEYTLLDKENDFSGHCDGVLFIRGFSKPFLFELKSMGGSRSEKLSASGELPLWYHVLQTSAYVHLLRKTKNLDIAGTIFVYVPRNIDDIFKQTKIFVRAKPKLASTIYSSITKEYQEAKTAIANRNYSALHKLCMTSSDAPNCPWNPLFCFSSNYEKHLKELTDEYESAIDSDRK